MMNRDILALVGCAAAVCLNCCSSEGTEPQGGTVIGSTNVDIDSRLQATHVGESSLANFLVDILKDGLNASGKDVDVAFLNAGAIRGGAINLETFAFVVPEDAKGKIYPKGDLRDTDVAGWLPFPNDHSIAVISGVQLKSVLERSANALPPDLAQDLGGWLLHGAGLAYKIDCQGVRQELSDTQTEIATEGSRIVYIEVAGKGVIYDTAASIDELATVQVRIAVNTFVFEGNDGHLAFREATNGEAVPLAEFDHVKAVEDYIRSHSPIAPTTDGRITVIGDCGRPATLP